MEKIIKGATIIAGENLTAIKDNSLWIKDGKINKIIPDDEIPEGINVINREGTFLFPGLVDLHVHVMWDGSFDPVATHEKESHEQMVIRAVSNCQAYVESGITTVRDLGSINDIALDVAEAINRNLIKGPRLIASGKTITMTGGHDPFWARFVDGPDEALKATREQIYKNAKVIKLSATGGVYGREEGEVAENSELTLEEMKVICDEAHRFGLKVSSHAIGREGIMNSILAGVDTIEHGHYVDDEIIELMIEKDVSWIPTLYIYEQIANQNGIPFYAQEKAANITGIHMKAFEKFFNSGVQIGAGSDAGACYTSHPSIIEELETMNKVIHSKKEILKTATSNAGEILGMKIGQISEGYESDFILLKENPLDHIENLKTVTEVYVKGEVIG